MPLLAGSDRATIGHNIHEMMASGHPYNQALAASLHNAHIGRAIAHRDAGGMTPAFAPSNLTAQPNVQNLLARFSSLPPEKLQELIPRLDPATASMAARILQSKRVMPTGGMQQPTPAMPQYGLAAQASGGMVRRATGGPGLSHIGPDGKVWLDSQAAIDSKTGLPTGAGFTTQTSPNGQQYSTFNGQYNGTAPGTPAIPQAIGGMSGMPAGNGTAWGGGTTGGGGSGFSPAWLAGQNGGGGGTTGGGGSGFSPAWLAGQNGGGQASGPVWNSRAPIYLGGMTQAAQPGPVGQMSGATSAQQNYSPIGLGQPATPTPTFAGYGINPNTGAGRSNTGLPALDNYLNATQAGASYASPKGYVAPPASTATATTNASPAQDFTPTVTSGPMKRGGGMEREKETVPILAAGGEFTISPEFVARLGNGDIKLGHRRLDEWVVAKRKEIIREMSRLKPPVKS